MSARRSLLIRKFHNGYRHQALVSALHIDLDAPEDFDDLWWDPAAGGCQIDHDHYYGDDLDEDTPVSDERYAQVCELPGEWVCPYPGVPGASALHSSVIAGQLFGVPS